MIFPDSGSPVLAPNLYPAQAGDPTGDILRGTEKPYQWDVAIALAAGYRFLPYLSAGIFFEYLSFQVADGTDTGDYADGTSQLQRQHWQLGAYGRYYLTQLHPVIHPWVELGLGYAQDTASYTRGSAQGPSGPVTSDYYVSDGALATKLRVGVDFRLHPMFAIGPMLGYDRLFPVNGCVTVTPQTDAVNPTTTVTPANTCDSSVVQASSYGVFYGGIFAKVTIGPDVR